MIEASAGGFTEKSTADIAAAPAAVYDTVVNGPGSRVGPYRVTTLTSESGTGAASPPSEDASR